MNISTRYHRWFWTAVLPLGFIGFGHWLLRAEPAPASPVRPDSGPPAAEKRIEAAGAYERFETIDQFRAKYRSVDFSGWLASRGRDAASLVTLWDLCRDEKALEEAGRRFPEDVLVGFAMLEKNRKTPGNALPWMEKLLAKEPGNPAVYYWKAAILKLTGDDGKAMAALKQGTEIRGVPDEHMRERVSTVRDAVLAGGGDAREAAVAAVMAGTLHGYDTYISSGVLTLLNERRKAAVQREDKASLEELARIGIGLAEHMRLTCARSAMDELASTTLLRSFLMVLDPETEYGTDGKKVGQRLAEMEENWSEMKALNRRSGDWAVTDLDAAGASEYLNLFLFRGEREAITWALNRRQ